MAINIYTNKDLGCMLQNKEWNIQTFCISCWMTQNGIHSNGWFGQRYYLTYNVRKQMGHVPQLNYWIPPNKNICISQNILYDLIKNLIHPSISEIQDIVKIMDKINGVWKKMTWSWEFISASWCLSISTKFSRGQAIAIM